MARWRRLEPALFGVLAVAQVLSMVAFRYLTNEDGMAHLASATVIAHYSGAFRDFYTIDWFPTPNLTGHVALAALARVLPAFTAEKVLVVAVAVALPWAARYAIHAVRRDATWLAYLALPLAISGFLNGGLYSFCLGLALFFVTIGFWLRHGGAHASPRSVAGLALLLVAVYLCHAVTFVMTVLFIALHAAWAGRDRWRELRLLATAAAPGAALLVAYAVLRSDVTSAQRRTIARLVSGLITLTPAMAVFGHAEIPFGFLVAATIGALTLLAMLRPMPRSIRDPRQAFLACALGTLVLYFVVPDSAFGGGFLSPRLSLFVFFALLLWVAQFAVPRGVAVAVVVVALVASVGLTATRVPKYRAFGRDLSEFLSARAVMRRGATVVPLYYVREDEARGGTAYSRYTRPLLQATGDLTASARVVDLSLYEAEFHYFPVRFRPAVNPFPALGRGGNWISQTPPHVDLPGYERATGRRVDYVLTWGYRVASRAVHDAPATLAVQRQLAAGYRRVFTSRRGLLEVYARTSDRRRAGCHGDRRPHRLRT